MGHIIDKYIELDGSRQKLTGVYIGDFPVKKAFAKVAELQVIIADLRIKGEDKTLVPFVVLPKGKRFKSAGFGIRQIIEFEATINFKNPKNYRESYLAYKNLGNVLQLKRPSAFKFVKVPKFEKHSNEYNLEF